MYRLEFEQAVGHMVTDEEYRKAELVLMNTKAIIGTQQIAYIYEVWGTEAIDILYSLVEERGKLIESLGEARKENSDLWKENRTLREFRDTIIREAQRKEPKLLPLEGKDRTSADNGTADFIRGRTGNRTSGRKAGEPERKSGNDESGQ